MHGVFALNSTDYFRGLDSDGIEPFDLGTPANTPTSVSFPNFASSGRAACQESHSAPDVRAVPVHGEGRPHKHGVSAGPGFRSQQRLFIDINNLFSPGFNNVCLHSLRCIG